MSWVNALREYAKQTGKFAVPKKGTPEYDAVRKIQASMEAPVRAAPAPEAAKPKRAAPKIVKPAVVVPTLDELHEMGKADKAKAKAASEQAAKVAEEERAVLKAEKAKRIPKVVKPVAPPATVNAVSESPIPGPPAPGKRTKKAAGTFNREERNAVITFA